MSDIFESKWGETKQALTEGLAGNKKKTMDVVLENTKRYLSEQATAGATSAGNVATLNRVILPVIRRVMPTVIANEIVGVQQMTGPVGQIHTLRIRYADTVASTRQQVKKHYLHSKLRKHILVTRTILLQKRLQQLL